MEFTYKIEHITYADQVITLYEMIYKLTYDLLNSNQVDPEKYYINNVRYASDQYIHINNNIVNFIRKQYPEAKLLFYPKNQQLISLCKAILSNSTTITTSLDETDLIYHLKRELNHNLINDMICAFYRSFYIEPFTGEEPKLKPHKEIFELICQKST